MPHLNPIKILSKPNSKSIKILFLSFSYKLTAFIKKKFHPSKIIKDKILKKNYFEYHHHKNKKKKKKICHFLS